MQATMVRMEETKKREVAVLGEERRALVARRARQARRPAALSPTMTAWRVR